MFLQPRARDINAARLAHLAALDLPLEGKSVLEVGAGIGLLSPFFEERGCKLLSTEGRAENLAQLQRGSPSREVRQVDLEVPAQITALGHFDIVFCYGTLYHVSTPAETLQALGAVSDMILLETCVTPGTTLAINLLDEMRTPNQAMSGTGCRPTRPWLMAELRNHWGNGYVTVSQPDHPDYPTDWRGLPEHPVPNRLTRAVFVGSRQPLDLPTLTTSMPDIQPRFAAT
jgi:hypothetical protein